MGCGWEVSVADARPWVPNGYTGKDPLVCVGYTTTLPEVHEVAEIRFYLHNGSLSAITTGVLTESVRVGIRILENAHNEVTSWALQQSDR